MYLHTLPSTYLPTYQPTHPATHLRTYLHAYIPRGSKYPNSRVLGPKVHTLNGFWTLKPYYLGTWTLRETYTCAFVQLCVRVFVFSLR